MDMDIVKYHGIAPQRKLQILQLLVRSHLNQHLSSVSEARLGPGLTSSLRSRLPLPLSLSLSTLSVAEVNIDIDIDIDRSSSRHHLIEICILVPAKR